MENEVKIIVRGTQWDEDGNKAVTETVLTGQYHNKNGTRYLLYEEIPEGETSAVKHTIKLKENVLELTKRGIVNARMVFEEGQTHMTSYATFYGQVELGIQTKHLTWQEQNNALEICVDYDLTSQDVVFSQCSLFIKAEKL